MQRSLSLKPWPLKFWLLLLVAAVVVPLSTLTGFVVWQARGSVRARAEDQLLHQAKANAIVVDAEFQRIETGLRALAASTRCSGRHGRRRSRDAVPRPPDRGRPHRPRHRRRAGILSTLWPPGESRPDTMLGPELLPLVASRSTEIGNLAPLGAIGRPPSPSCAGGGAARRPGAFLLRRPARRPPRRPARRGGQQRRRRGGGGGRPRRRDRRSHAERGGLSRRPLACPSTAGRGVLHTEAGVAGGAEGRRGGGAPESLAFARAPRSGTPWPSPCRRGVQAPLGGAVLRVVALAGAFLMIGGALAALLARRFRAELRQATRAGPPAAAVLREADELGRSVAEAAAARDRATAGLAASEHRFRALAEAGALAVWRSDAGARGGRPWLERADRPDQGGDPRQRLAGRGAPGGPRRHGGRVVGGARGRAAGGDGVPRPHRVLRRRRLALGARTRRAGGASQRRGQRRVDQRDRGHPRPPPGRGAWPSAKPAAPDGGGGQSRHLGVRRGAGPGRARRLARGDRAVARGQRLRLRRLAAPAPPGRPEHPPDGVPGDEEGAQTRFSAEFRVRRRPPAEGWAWVSSSGAVVDRDAATGAPLRIAGISRDVSERREAEARRLLLAREVDHRAKNLLAVVQSVLRLTPRDPPDEFAAAVERRVAALARAHTLLAERGWAAADLGAVAAREMGGLPAGTARLEGPPAALVASAVQPVAMALHELTTNACKHGALSRPEGRVTLRWRLDPDSGTLRLTWTESGGPKVSAPPVRRGFGSRMIEATLEGQLRGSLALHWQPGGLRAEIALPAARVLAADAGPEARAEEDWRWRRSRRAAPSGRVAPRRERNMVARRLVAPGRGRYLAILGIFFPAPVVCSDKRRGSGFGSKEQALLRLAVARSRLLTDLGRWHVGQYARLRLWPEERALLPPRRGAIASPGRPGSMARSDNTRGLGLARGQALLPPRRGAIASPDRPGSMVRSDKTRGSGFGPGTSLLPPGPGPETQTLASEHVSGPGWGIARSDKRRRSGLGLPSVAFSFRRREGFWLRLPVSVRSSRPGWSRRASARARAVRRPSLCRRQAPPDPKGPWGPRPSRAPLPGREAQVASVQLAFDARLLCRREFHPEPCHPGVQPHQLTRPGLRLRSGGRGGVRPRLGSAGGSRGCASLRDGRVIRRAGDRLHGANEAGATVAGLSAVARGGGVIRRVGHRLHGDHRARPG